MPNHFERLQSVGAFYHGWVTEAVTSLIFKRLNESVERPRYRWDAFLNPAPIRIEAVASQTEQAARTSAPKVTAEKKAPKARKSPPRSRAKEAG